jgi:heat shock protein HtpX
MLDRSRLAELRRRNALQSAVVLVGMAALLAALGWSVAGWNGVAWGLLGGGVALLLQPRLSWRMLRALYGARPLSSREAPGLCDLVGELARRASLPAAPALFYIPSRIAQAATVGRGVESAIGITDGLLRVLSDRELAAVIAHEISHIRHRDLWLLELASAANRLTSLFSTFGLVLVVLYLPLLLVGEVELPLPTMLLLLFAPTVSALLQLRLARTRELDADAGAIELTGDPHGLALALDKLERLQGGFFEGFVRSGQGWLGKLLRTHPDTAERIRHLEVLAPAERMPAPLPAELFFGSLGEPARAHPVWLDWLRRSWY